MGPFGRKDNVSANCAKPPLSENIKMLLYNVIKAKDFLFPEFESTIFVHIIWESDTLDIMDIHGYHGYPWPLLDMYGYGYCGYPNVYPK